MKNIWEFCKAKYVYLICFIHFLVSCIWSRFFFISIRENTGSENIAYKFKNTGITLETDSLSRALCWTYSHILAILIIAAFWNWIFFLTRSWRNSVVKRKYIALLFVFIVTGIVLITALYPSTLTTPPDTRWNYVYAKEWLPMYWHGFLTNVVHCACLLVFPHPIAMSIIPFLFGINVIAYFTYHTVIRYAKKHKIFCGLLWAAILLLMPETFQVLTYAGRNYMYAILSTSVLGVLLKDHLENRDLDKKKFILLSFLEVCLATWRSEGIIYFILYPFMLYFVYFFRKTAPGKTQLIKGIGYLCVLYLLFSLPGKYGNEKYQGYDYFIINTPGALSAVLKNDKANVTYDGADIDLAKINQVIPLDYIYNYGDSATINYNWDCGRLHRQCNAGISGRDYVMAAYHLLLRNGHIFFKYQINMYFYSIGLPYLPVGSAKKWEPQEAGSQKQSWVLEYYTIGQSDIKENYGIVFLNQKIDGWIREKVSMLTSLVYRLGWSCSGFVKIAVTLATVVLSVIFLKKKVWIYTFWGLAITGLLAVIISASPGGRENYYYSVYYNQYWFLLFAGIWLKKMKTEESV